VPPYILPGPVAVLETLLGRWSLLLNHAGITASEIVLGFVLGAVFGTVSGLMLATFATARRWLLPIFVVSQALPVFALAPLLVLWLGYGMASKVAMAVLIIFFPVASSFYHGMRRTDGELLELGRIMGSSKTSLFQYIIIPSALPAFGSGLRVATAVAPIGAVVGEWVGSSSGLGFYMLHANARMQIDRMFAALTVLAVVSLLLYFVIDTLVSKTLYWENPKDLTHEKIL